MDLRTTQLKDTYGNLVTTGTSAGAPTSGGLQNGQGTLLTSVGINTNSPAKALHIYDSAINKTAQLKISDGSSDTSAYIGSFANTMWLTNGGTYAGSWSLDGAYGIGVIEIGSIDGGSLIRLNTASSNTTSTERMKIHSSGDISFRDGSTNEAFYWDASEARLGIGTDTPSSELHVAIGGKLTIGAAQNTEENSLLQLGQNALYGIWELKAKTNVGYTPRTRLTLYGQSGGDASDDIITFRTDGNVGIGTTSPDAHLEISANAGADPSPVTNPVTLRLTDAGNASTGSGDTTNPYAKIEFYSEDVSSSGPAVQAQIAAIYDDIYSAGSHLAFYTSFSPASGVPERMRIDSSGRVGIGTDSPGTNLHIEDSSGATLRLTTPASGGTSTIQAVGYDSANVSRLSSTIDFESVAGSGTANGHIIFSTYPSNSKTERMRILSDGGITFNGDTATANALDDYEEGTFTPTLEGASTAGTYTFSTNQSVYTKIGRQVTVISRLIVDTASGGVGSAKFGGLPFTKVANTTFVGSVRLSNVDVDNSTINLSTAAWTISASTEFYIESTLDNASGSIIGIAGISNGDTIEFSFTYFV